jgi:SAM-dependent methyltransferase
MSTTHINPGANKARPKRTVRNFVGELIGKVKKGDVADACRYALSEGSNMLHERNISGTKEEKFICNVCGYKGGYFVNLTNFDHISWNASCPKCDSRPRHRGLYVFYQKWIADHKPQSIIHYAPEPIFYPMLKPIPVYKTTDLFLEDVDFPKVDVQNSGFAEGSYDLILNNHVIEHVPDDESAFKDLYKILKPGGTALITIPGNFKRQETIYFKDLSNNGHYRDYGLDVLARLKNIFDEAYTVSLYDFEPTENPKMGLRENDIVFVCKKKA